MAANSSSSRAAVGSDAQGKRADRSRSREDVGKKSRRIEEQKDKPKAVGAKASDADEQAIGGDATPMRASSSPSSSSSYYEYTIASDDGEPPPPKKAGGDTKEDIIHFHWDADMILDSRYWIVRLLGDGTFGRVLLAYDQRRKRQVAIKVIRDVEKYRRCAKREAELLRDIREADPDNKSRCVRLHDKFLHDGRYFCLVTEPLGASLYDLLKLNHYRGFCLQDIQYILRQCLQALSFLHDELHMAHTDLKLENILFKSSEEPQPAIFPREGTQRESRHRHSPYVRPAHASIKLIDFGNATYDDDHHSRIINTRQYRAPEVICHIGWNERSDLWSMGCIAMETYTGELLFRTHGNLEHLGLMEKIIEPLPQFMFDQAGTEAKDEFLSIGANGTWDLRRDELAADTAATKKISNVPSLAEHVLSQHRLLAECAALMLRPNPSKRPAASELLRHPFFSASYTERD